MSRALLIGVATAVAAGLTALPAGAEPPGPTPGPPPGPSPETLTAVDADGSYAVGTDILPGVYTSAGPVAGDVCYWRRVGGEDTTLANAMTKQPQVVQIEPTDLTFTTRGCQPWHLTVGAAPPAQTPPWLAQLQLRQHLDVLNGLAGGSGNGQLPPY